MSYLGQWRLLEEGEATTQRLPGNDPTAEQGLSEVSLLGRVKCIGLPVSMSLSHSVCLCLSVSQGLTQRAQCIVGFPHKILIQLLEYELGHSLKRGRAGLAGRHYWEAEFWGLGCLGWTLWALREIPKSGSAVWLQGSGPRPGSARGFLGGRGLGNG